MTLEVLLVEDNAADVRLTREAFRDANHVVHISVAPDGADAMRFLRREGVHTRAPRPDLILLDLDLPNLDGREVLTQIKLDPNLKSIPTIILTASVAEPDIVLSYQHHANAYLNKPGVAGAYESLVRSINEFWLTEVKLPNHQVG